METRNDLYEAQLARLQLQVAHQDEEKAALEVLLHQQHPDGSPGQVCTTQLAPADALAVGMHTRLLGCCSRFQVHMHVTGGPSRSSNCGPQGGYRSRVSGCWLSGKPCTLAAERVHATRQAVSACVLLHGPGSFVTLSCSAVTPVLATRCCEAWRLLQA